MVLSIALILIQEQKNWSLFIKPHYVFTHIFCAHYSLFNFPRHPKSLTLLNQ